ncbi:fimbria/pilus chaperone family protein [Sphingopyxis sp. MWB1]|uniref:fimbria/pilus chaperone family protein n=1 Tax=Sphingopyxis sp. MWB1 TaxID=1537715 RepID=UPI0009E04DE3|nr:fimbria/pilus chaperone family protein [Sphingopyxis sp. MWB1]
MNISFKTKIVAFAISATVTAGAAPLAHADGMQPETSVVILNEADGETSLNVKNTDEKPSLLYTQVVDIPEDQDALVMLTPPVTRVEPGETQLVRFLLNSKEPLKTQRLKRVIFEGIPQRKSEGSAKIGVTVRQNLPLIIHPKGLERNREPWKLLQWKVEGGRLSVTNDSPYVVRLAQEVTLRPVDKIIDLGRTYVLPGETLTAEGSAESGATSITISPATVYGYSVDTYDAPLEIAAR